MAFDAAWRLVKMLEGKGLAGEQYGMTQGTWHNLGFEGSVEAAAEHEIMQAYRKLWESCKIQDPEVGSSRSVFEILGDPADAVAFQCFINLPWRTFHELLQLCVGAVQDGKFGPATYHSIMKMRPSKLAEKILDAQAAHYKATAQPQYLQGLLNRVKRVDMWLAGKADPKPPEPPPLDLDDLLSGSWI